MDNNERKRIANKVGFWDKMKVGLSVGDHVQKEQRLKQIADKNEEDERRRKAAESAALTNTNSGDNT